MVTVIGNVSETELRRLHPDKFVEPQPEPKITEGSMSAEQMINTPRQSTESPTGVMVLIEIIGGPIIYAVDFNTWTDPDGPTLREAQAFRATRDVCRKIVNQTMLHGWAVGNFVSNEDAESIVESMMAHGAATMRVLDVPKKAFA